MNHIHQYGIFSALMQGFSSDGATVSDILSKCNHGLGTVCNLNGEIVIVDGEAYHFTPDNQLHKLKPTDHMPMIVATDFQPTMTKTLDTLHMDNLKQALHPFFPTKQNNFIAVRIDATFKKIVYRIGGPQMRPREPLLELAQRQVVKTYENIAGTLFGFYSPPYTNGICVAGFHLHFLSADRSAGGHILEFEAENAVLNAAVNRHVHLELPESEEFNRELMQPDLAKDLHLAE
ncbi:acetolactate decarboxylase [Aspergillus saccharolyticus JOP 1030-1]|uniref:Alpha-acetolactate decarboxylase n=1 Tax=Aspergillus saccharolyticus JOP 1030-1 TaxID=1450539 RepID=A0A318ZPS6_9EURO|nr:alpha-acetolactate decarboxylase [Aspergillus saccharolyticus JOP 1030-1]PYH48544.1 alpha-acetolactate decarboxylase [Aspergillus saccharolyticus JOP 1030-1]